LLLATLKQNLGAPEFKDDGAVGKTDWKAA
jgi:hypothetical protein